MDCKLSEFFVEDQETVLNVASEDFSETRDNNLTQLYVITQSRADANLNLETTNAQFLYPENEIHVTKDVSTANVVKTLPTVDIKFHVESSIKTSQVKEI